MCARDSHDDDYDDDYDDDEDDEDDDADVQNSTRNSPHAAFTYLHKDARRMTAEGMTKPVCATRMSQHDQARADAPSKPTVWHFQGLAEAQSQGDD